MLGCDVPQGALFYETTRRREIVDMTMDLIGKFAVALLAEGVDRNLLYPKFIVVVPRVALLAEGVDRNLICEEPFLLADAGRPPRGGRG